MSTELSAASEAFIADAVSRGVYSNREQAIDAGIEMLRTREELVAKIVEGRRQLDEGEYVQFDQAGLRQFFDGLKERARTAAQAKQHG
jgi:Arc/MetJ-type ribon-helix-helix transcriptional regulator